MLTKEKIIESFDKYQAGAPIKAFTKKIFVEMLDEIERPEPPPIPAPPLPVTTAYIEGLERELAVVQKERDDCMSMVLILETKLAEVTAERDEARRAGKQAYGTLLAVGYNPEALAELRKAFDVEGE